MYDPILQRPLFQPAASSTQGAGTSVMPKAKGTGITSMVTSPDVAAEQLRSVVNPMKPIVQGFADGGIFGGYPGELYTEPTPYGEIGQNPGWGHDGQPFVMSREKVPLGTGQEYQDWAKQHSNGVDAAITDVASNVASNITGASKVQPVSFNRDSFASSSNPVTVAATSPYVASNVPSSVPVAPTRYTPVISTPVFPELPFQGGVQRFADGGPVQHFQQGGMYPQGGGPVVASMWDNFVKSLTVPEPDRSGRYRLPDIGLRTGVNDSYRNEPAITTGGPSYRENIEPDVVREPGQQFVNPYKEETSDARERQVISGNSPEFLSLKLAREEEQRQANAYRALMEQARNTRSKAGTTQFERSQQPQSFNVDDEAEDRLQRVRAFTKGIGSQISFAAEQSRRDPSVEDFVNPYGKSPVQESDERAQIEGIRSLRGTGQLPPVVNIDEGKKTEPQRQATSDVGLNLQQIKADREAKSSADRRENALLALMNAGFAMAAGKSPHALQNIGAGGQAGIQAFAEMEKQRRDTEYKQYLQDLHERELRMRQAEQDIKAPLYKAQAEYFTSRPESERQRQQLRETTAMYNARKEAAQEFMRRKKDDFNFAQQFNNPATGPAMEKEWMTRRTRELMPEHLAREMNNANNYGYQGNVSPTNAE